MSSFRDDFRLILPHPTVDHERPEWHQRADEDQRPRRIGHRSLSITKPSAQHYEQEQQAVYPADNLHRHRQASEILQRHGDEEEHQRRTPSMSVRIRRRRTAFMMSRPARLASIRLRHNWEGWRPFRTFEFSSAMSCRRMRLMRPGSIHCAGLCLLLLAPRLLAVDFAPLEALVSSELKRNNVPGAAVTIVVEEARVRQRFRCGECRDRRAGVEQHAVPHRVDHQDVHRRRPRCSPRRAR